MSNLCSKENVNVEKCYKQEEEESDSVAIDRDSDNDNDNILLPNVKPELEISRMPGQSSKSSKSIKSMAASLKKLPSRSNASVIDPGPPPDGGLKAWTQSFMGHFVVFNTWGMIASFGIFQTYYTSNLGFAPSSVSWIGSIQMCLHFSFGMFSGRAFDAGYFYWLITPGVILAALGQFMTSLCSQYWQFLLAQGILTGIGCGLQFTPTMSLVSTYFSGNRNLAVAIMASGSATGGLVYPTIMRQLLPKLGFSWAVRVAAFIMLAVGSLYCSLLRPRLPPRKTGPLLELSAFKEAPYTLFCIGTFLVIWGQFFAFYYVGAFGVQIIGIPYTSSVNLLMIMNGMGLIGRLIPSYLADLKFGPYNTTIPFAFITGIILFCWASVHSVGTLYAFSITYGLLTAGFQGLFPATMTSLTKDMSKVGVRNGMGFGIAGLAALTGPPLAGALIQRNGGNYFVAQMWSGSVVILGAFVLVLGRLCKTGWVLRKRV